MYELLEKAFIPKSIRQPGISGLERLWIKGQKFSFYRGLAHYNLEDQCSTLAVDGRVKIGPFFYLLWDSFV